MDNRRSETIRARWVASPHATTTTVSNSDSAPVSYNNGISAKSQVPVSRAALAKATQRARIGGCKMASSFWRCPASRNTVSRKRARSASPPGPITLGPKASRTASLTPGSSSSNSLATLSASKQLAGSHRSNWRVNVDFPVAMPPVIPKTGTSASRNRPQPLFRKSGSFRQRARSQRLYDLFFFLILVDRLTCGINQAGGDKHHEVLFQMLID